MPTPPIIARAQVARAPLVGLPIWVTLELENRGPGWVGPLQPLDLHDAPGGWSFRAARDGQTVAELPAGPDPGELHGVDPGFILFPGERRRFLVDLSEVLGEFIVEGEYVGSARHGQLDLEVEFEFAVGPLEDDELALARRLRGPGSWMEGLVFGRPELTVHDQLSARCVGALRLHRWLHDAVRAPSVAAIVRDGLGDLRAPLEGEAFAFDYEITVARDEPRAMKLRDELVTRWPGLSWRAEAVHEGLGALLLLQELFQLQSG